MPRVGPARLSLIPDRADLRFARAQALVPPPRSRRPAHLTPRLAGCSDTNAAGGGRSSRRRRSARHGTAPTSGCSPGAARAGTGPGRAGASGRRSAVSSATVERHRRAPPSSATVERHRRAPTVERHRRAPPSSATVKRHRRRDNAIADTRRQQVVSRMPTPPANRPPDPDPSPPRSIAVYRPHSTAPPTAPAHQRTAPPRPTARPVGPPPDAHDPALGHLPVRRPHGARRLADPPRLRAHRRHRPPGRLDRPPPAISTSHRYRHQPPAAGTGHRPAGTGHRSRHRHRPIGTGTSHRHRHRPSAPAPTRPTATGTSHRSPTPATGHRHRPPVTGTSHRSPGHQPPVTALPATGHRHQPPVTDRGPRPSRLVSLPSGPCPMPGGPRRPAHRSRSDSQPSESGTSPRGLTSRPWLRLCGIPDSSVCSGRDAAPRLLTNRSRGLTRRWGDSSGLHDWISAP